MRIVNAALRLTISGWLLVGMAAASASETRTFRDAAALFSTTTYMDHVRTLASDEYEGRGTGQPGNDLAARYIAEHFKELGLKPAGDDGGYLQYFDARRGKKFDDKVARFEITALEKEWQPKRDWTPFPFSQAGDFDGPVVFVGYGIHSPDDGIDDYADIDVKDKVVLALRYEPRSDDPEAAIGGEKPSRHALFATKASVAKSRGAKAMLIANPPSRDEKDELYRFGRDGARETYDLPMIHIKREIAEELLRRGALPALAELEKSLGESRTSRSAELPEVHVSVRTGLSDNSLKTQNVVAVLEGEGAPSEYVVVGAHFDHLGIAPRMFGGEEKFIHNGADDNASGTAGLLEMARVLTAAPRLRRSIVFIAFSGEEMGLLGSKHWVDHPTVPLSGVKAMLNFDMIGRFADEAVLIYGAQTATEFPALLERIGSESGVTFKAARSLPGNSDHASFQAKNIPVLFPFTGLHRQYHRPEDDWELIRPEGAARILRFSFLALVELASLTDGPTWSDPKKAGVPTRDEDDPGRERPARRAATAPVAGDSPTSDTDAAPPPMPRVRLGVMPDYSEDDRPGLRITDVTADSAAQKAGLRGGDRIVRIGETDVRGIETYMLALGKVNPGDEVEIVVEREGERVTLKATLPAAPAARPKE